MSWTAEALASESTRQGFRTTVRQLESLRNIGVLHLGKQQGLGYAKGSRWLYPSETVNRLIAFYRLRRPKETQAAAALRLWLAGYDFDESKLRRCLARALRRFYKFQAAAVRRGPVELGEYLVDLLTRKPELGLDYGATAAERHANAQLLGESLANVLSTTAGPPSPEGIVALINHMKITPTTEAVIQAAFKTTIAAELPSATQQMSAIKETIESATGEDLQAAREFLSCAREIRLALDRIPGEYAPRQLLESFATIDPGPFAFAMILLALARIRPMSTDIALANIRSVQATILALAERVARSKSPDQSLEPIKTVTD